MSERKDNLVVAPSLWQQFFDNNGLPLSGGKVFVFRAGTNIKVDTYKDSQGLAVNDNPIVLDASGFCRIFIENSKTYNEERREDEAVGYRFDIYDKKNNLIRTIDPVFAIAGVDGKNTGKILYGPPGKQGKPGKSIPGDSIQGDIGPRGFGGKSIYRRKESGEYTFIVPKGVDKIFYTIGGAGGGFHLVNELPKVGSVATGVAGKIISGEINVNENDEIKIVVGKRGIVSKSILDANGKATTIEHRKIGKITASGGNAGKNNNINSSDSYYQRMSPFIQQTLFNGEIINFIPRAIFGETTIYGQGGNIYMNKENPNAIGNCASGGTGIPTVAGSDINIGSFGEGGDGIVILEYNLEPQEEGDNNNE